jgi:electron transfer flavoprotein alpha subunit
MVASLYSVSETNTTIWVYLEQEGGVLERVSLELLAKGRQMADQMGWPLVGLLLGHQVSGIVSKAFAYGADQVYLADHRLLETFTIDAYTHVVHQALMEARPNIFLLGATPNGRDLAGRLAVRIRTGLNADCTGLYINPENGVLVSEVSGFGGGILALIEMQNHRPQMATVRPGVFSIAEPDHTRQGVLLSLEVDLSEEKIQTRILERVVGAGVDLSGVLVLVAGGRGIEGDFKMLKDLADLLGGDIGATRPPVDEGYIERERQIGQTGVVCSPKVAICCGISGAFHFVVGIEKADTCIVGDVHQVIPELITALREKHEVAYA